VKNRIKDLRQFSFSRTKVLNPHECGVVEEKPPSFPTPAGRRVFRPPDVADDVCDSPIRTFVIFFLMVLSFVAVF
jgi:hypothetical protein